MGEIGFDMAPDAGQKFEIARLAVAPGEARKDPCDTEITVRAEDGLGGVKRLGVERGKGGDKARDHVGCQPVRYVAPHILEK